MQDIDSMQLLQQRIQDACLIDIQVVHVEGVMVFVTTYGNNGGRKVINDAIDFFRAFFTDFKAWHLMTSNREMIIWFRLFGIPLHASVVALLHWF